MVKCHCGKHAIFNKKGEKKGKFCYIHKEIDMVDVKNKTCEHPGCETLPTYNKRGERKGKFCLEHKEPDMVNVLNKTCEHPGCETQPAYNKRGEKKGAFCSEHKEPDMINVKDKTCEHPGCETQPTYNKRGEKKGAFCSEHKEPDMVNVKDKTCEHPGCEIIPTYNKRGEKKGAFCSKHKEPDMVDVKNKTCEHPGCETQPTYNKRGEKKGAFCSEHKEPDMINIVSKTCEYPGCETQTTYGFLGKIKSKCASHKQKGMIIAPTRKCKCKQLGTHELNGERFCEDHMPPDAINLGLKPCINCGLDNILTKGKCDTCDPTLITIRTKTKENRIRDVLQANEIVFIHDKMLEGTSCATNRPDFQIDCGTHYVYVEVDENQHKSYACECEQTRMINLVHVRGMPVTFIRYNPDVYDPAKGQRYASLQQREKKLVEYIKHAMKNSPSNKDIVADVLYLYYDGHDNSEPVWHTLI